jgi:hypothetical protein
MRLNVFVISCLLIVVLGLSLHSTKSFAGHVPVSTPQRRQPQQRLPEVFDAIDQPPSIYKASTDQTRVPRRRDPKLNQELLSILNDPAITTVREQPIGSNTGPEVRQYLEYCGIHEPAWWCAAFVSFQINQGSLRAQIPSNWRALANCVDIFNWAKKHNLLLSEPGVPSVMLIPGNPRKHQRKYAHTGFVVEYDSRTQMITTVEGNSNNDGSNNGIGVFRLRRKVKPGMKFVRIV